MGARPRSFTSKHDREQFKKLGDHPNLIYTDGNEWALYRLGELVGSVVSSAGDITADGTAAYGPKEALLLEQLLRNFFSWQPIVPKTPRALAELLAPLTRLLRENVRTALSDPRSALSALAKEWRDVFFPDANDAQFADGYAQTVTYALLLARVEGELDLAANAANRLDARHGLLAQVLRVSEQKAARDEVESAVALLERAITAVEPEALVKSAKNEDIWLYFYEDFLAAYDSKLRKQAGVYYTPAEVVRAQVTLADLDKIRPTTWPAEFTEELLRVLWILERTVELGPQLDELLDQIVASPVYRASELPGPTEGERKAPTA